MADNANATCDPAEPTKPGAGSAGGGTADRTGQPQAGEGTLAQQRISGILQAVLDDEEAASGSKSRRYPWYIDAALGIGLLLVVGGFSLGMFKMYISHQAKLSIEEGNYQAAIALLKGNPVPSFINLGGDRDDDPDELLARALYMDAMKKMDNNDIKGGLAQLMQIRSGTHEFATAQKILEDNFEPSSTQLTGGVVDDVQNNGRAGK